MTSSYISANTKSLSFTVSDNMVINSSYNFSNHVFSSLTVSQRSLYWFQLCAGVPAKTKTNYSLNGLYYSAVVYSSADSYPADQLTVDTLQWVGPKTTLTVSNNEPLFSSLSMETAWLGFTFSNQFYPLVAFAVQLYKTQNFYGKVAFDRVLVNEGMSYNIANSDFVVPVSGIYFFTVIVAIHANLMINNKDCKLSVCACSNVRKSGAIRSIRGSVMLTLNATDTVHVASQYSESYEGGLTNFHGFLYSPTSEYSAAWSVSQSILIRGPDNNVNFSIINTNKLDCWKASVNKVIIPKTGIYYVDICSYFCGTPFYYCPGDGNGEIQVLRNDNPIITIRLNLATFENCVSRSRSVIINLNVNDELKIAVPTKACIYADAKRQNSFNGFMLSGSI